jgi:ribosomal protein S13
VKNEKLKNIRIACNLLICLLSVPLMVCVCGSGVSAAIRDSVVAFVDNIAITASDLEARYADTVKVDPAITREEVLSTMVNRTLMLREAKKMRLEAASEDELLKEYINLKIKAFIRIKDEEIADFYNKHIGDFKGKELDAVRDKIEEYLTEKELNKRLEAHIKELRQKACVQVQLGQK